MLTGKLMAVKLMEERYGFLRQRRRDCDLAQDPQGFAYSCEVYCGAPSRISRSDLIRKSEAFLAKNPKLKGRKMSFKGLSIEDM